MVDVTQVTEPVRRWAARRGALNEGSAAPSVPVPEGVRIRPRKDGQVAACSRLLGLVAAEDGYPRPRPASRREWLTGDDLLQAWVAEEDDRIQGHVAIVRLDGDRMAAFRWREVTGRPASELVDVSRLFVRASARGRGLGTALLETAVQEARARGLTPVSTTVSTSRRGLGLYDRAGWRLLAMYPCGERRDGLETYLYLAPPA